MARDETCPRTTLVSDKAFIRSSVALRAPPSGITLSANYVGFLRLSGGSYLIAELLEVPALFGKSPRRLIARQPLFSRHPSAFPGIPIRDARSAEWGG